VRLDWSIVSKIGGGRKPESSICVRNSNGYCLQVPTNNDSRIKSGERNAILDKRRVSFYGWKIFALLPAPDYTFLDA
jgi:hypothetical protein